MTESSTKSKFFYQDGETVLCYHGPLLYEAKCLKAEEKDNIPQYLIHYSGWNKSWDEWVPGPRVLKYNDENLKKQKDLLNAHGGRAANRLNKNPRRSVALYSDKGSENEKPSLPEADKSYNEKTIETPVSKTKSEETRDTTKRRKPRYEEIKDNTDNYTIKSEVRIKVADDLKRLLAEDSYTIRTQNKLPVLPSNKTVEAVLDDYLQHKLKNQCDKNIIIELISGVKDYFDAVVSTKLLYKFEKLQYNEIIKQHSDKKPSQVYGTIHLLRLFVKIGELLSYTAWDELGVKQLQFNLEDIVNYIQENRSKLFSPKDYYNPTLNYIQRSS